MRLLHAHGAIRNILDLRGKQKILQNILLNRFKRSLTFTIPVFLTLKKSQGIGDCPKRKTIFEDHCYFGFECIICDSPTLQ